MFPTLPLSILVPIWREIMISLHSATITVAYEGIMNG